MNPPPWKDMFQVLPADAQVVWVRRARWFYTPALASWADGAGEFNIVATGKVLPWWEIRSWRAQ